MTDYNYDYNYDENGDQPQGQDGKIRGYRIVIIALAAILVALCGVFFLVVRPADKADFNMEKELLLGQYDDLQGEFDGLRSTNDTLNLKIAAERQRADSIVKQLSKERTLSANQIRKYQKELSTMRTVMRGYVSTIDSLNKLNTVLIGENREMREQVTTERLGREKAEETVGELSTKVRQGSVIRARDITLTPMSQNNKDIQRVNRATQLRVDLVLAANTLAEPGPRAIYARVISPDGYLLANEAGAVFVFEGENRPYTAVREIDYQNNDLGVTLFYKGAGITAGVYKIEVYMDGYMVGSTEVSLR